MRKRYGRSLRILFTSSLLSVALLSACSQSPTGRSQILLFSNEQVNQMGTQAYTDIKQQEPVSSDAALNRYVRCIADALIQELPAEQRQLDWEVTVFDSDTVNAFALPGGKIGVYRGLHEVAKTPAQLAAVMGHEIGHVIAEHGNARMSSNMLIGAGMQIGAVLAAQQTDAQTAAMIMAGLGVGVQVGFTLPYSRSHETESDLLGLEYMAAAGFDPAHAADLWRNMAQQGGGATPEFLSTHPTPTTRIDALEAAQPQVQPLYQARVQQGNLPNCQRPS